MKAYCFFCGDPLDPDGRSTYRSIKGWEGKRSKGGQNYVPLKEQTGDFAHKACVEREIRKRKDHVSQGQTAFEGLL